MFNNKTLLITGGTGSFGNAVLERFLSNVKEIRIFSRDEKKQDDMRNKYQNSKIKFFIGDVRNFESIQKAMIGVDYVFHAAALKQVPSCEFFPVEATLTNVLGTDNVINAAVIHKVKNVICLSTDKAAYPINAMGLSKGLMEKVAIAASRNTEKGNTKICITRYGNVMASRGSVIPLFVEQIKAGKHLTVTDPNMTRFLMSLDEAVDLVIFAFEKGKQGDVFIQKAPASTIHNLAKAIQEVFNSNSQIEVIGTRHGEKLYETLCTREEMSRAFDLQEFYQIPSDNRDLNYSKYFTHGNIRTSELDDYTSHNTIQLNIEQIKEKLLSLDYIQRELKEWNKE
jgi:UDP-N-acetylglucosamine 4,6-dehydratase/5-epimerase